ncbi:hypothetical protein QBC34DRAFT_1779 [Podospora aff. communis PSN243]|uniref:Uncharacterized protein n=1 Tax=Podospora aff. communis PSN243 TaxID=3040156 RepID=A0AAV9H7T3_9PEZI|nr:hypothetical protein QBC34DRAFT_1779 [Podospora aff. communis PSN243]
MDDTARLVSELHDKLADLDGKVAAYQRDMLAQFHKHMDDCLKGYPQHVSNEVSRVIAASMSKYPALCPRDSEVQSPRSSDDLEEAARKAWDGRKSPPPILYHTSGKPKDGPRSPHQREKEFQGLFTPSYLPHLDSSYNSPLQSPPISPQPQAEPAVAPAGDAPEKVEEPTTPAVATEGAARPGPVRRSTDRSLSSVESSGSDTKVRRSALRRSSSSAKGSPRRVRFDFEGAEVLPSASPQDPVAILVLPDEAETPEPQAEPEAPIHDTSAIAEVDESSYGLGMSLLDVEGEEDLLPRPRKVSSTQALQALTRSPLDAGTTWTVVNPDPEEVPKVNGNKEVDGASEAEVRGPPQSLASFKLKPDIMVIQQSSADNHRLDELLGSPIEELEEYHDEDDDSDEEFLSMSTKLSRKTPSPVAQMPFPKAPAASTAVPAPTAAGSKGATQSLTRSLLGLVPTNKTTNEDVEGDVFSFDDDGGQTEKYLPDDDENEDEPPISEQLRLRLANAGNAPTPPLEADDRSTTTTVPPVSPSTGLFGASIGSYNGRPLVVNPMNNPQLYDEIASMKNVHFLVGSIDGRTGVDSADAGSYRASLAKHVTGTPRSFTERLALEEAMERREGGNQ